jgi:hypothetical protein
MMEAPLRANESSGFPLRTMADMNHALEVVDDADRRVLRVLELLRDVVPYDECALLQVTSGEPLVITPGASSEDRARLVGTVTTFFDLFADVDVAAQTTPNLPPARPGLHLALPLIGFGEVLGLLFVRAEHVDYTLQHLQSLGEVAGKLGAYAAMRSAAVVTEQLSRDLERVRADAALVARAHAEVLQRVRDQLRTLHASIATPVVTSHNLAEALDRVARDVAAELTRVDVLVDASAQARSAEP